MLDSAGVVVACVTRDVVTGMSWDGGPGRYRCSPAVRDGRVHGSLKIKGGLVS